ncbi:anchored repeat-type ABC transporter ATP-binding subunit [Corynebacterium cystitidis]|uniref:anchored repeat-type ABC transporter ATP-binding subunit n=1 Tax=Corynebacterium cystitidis TaxID=35757 RepID=UPI00211EA215|nr:anchored repeat-type ABC transporter ATP-binding subunit [Corynebacterium cystitidis]
MSALEIKDLEVDLSGREVVKGVDLTVDAGEFVGLVGPNGAGKTTMLRAILGLIPVRGGEIIVDKHSRPAQRRDRIGYVPQRHEFAWDFPIDVHDCVLNGRTRRSRFTPVDYEATARALDRVNLADLASRPIGELSGGQRQRVLLARALATEPAVLLLDEPFTGLDLPSSEQLLALFTQLASQGVAIVMSTHNLAEAMHSCHRLLLFNGQIVADGPPESLRDPDVWMQTFGVSAHSPLLTTVGARL